ncbi:ERMES complex Ca(2+)-binding regulatory GTPase gem1 [Tilletia horrida]|nr:ERMES complex Ca(2+)-binding regulatory GTPase gem1 [Tilletia horrida]
MPRELRCVLVGDSGVGKSTIITSLVKESFAPRVQRVVPELTLPPSVSPEGVTIKIIDTAAVAITSPSAAAGSSLSPPSNSSSSHASDHARSTHASPSHPPRQSSGPTSLADQQRAHLEAEVRRASVICLVYSISTPSTFERIPTFWLPYIRSILSESASASGQGRQGSKHTPTFRTSVNGGMPEEDEDDDASAFTPSIPVILVGNKIDLRGSDPVLISAASHPSELSQSALEQELAPVMAEFREVETCVETSAFLHINISEIFYFAQKAVLYPTAPLYDSREQRLRYGCVEALKRIFMLCDNDQDGVLNDRELNNFQKRCFDAPLHPRELEGVKELVLAAPVGGRAGGAHNQHSSRESHYAGSSNASAAGGNGGKHSGSRSTHGRRSQGTGGAAPSNNGSRLGPDGRTSVSGSSTDARSASTLGNGRRYRGSRADSFTSNETISQARQQSHRQRTLSNSSTASTSGSHPHIRNGGLTLAGFLYLHLIFIQRGRLETTWTVLRSFGYSCPTLKLEDSYIHPAFPIPPDHAVELSPHGYQFLTDVFEAHDKDRDGALSRAELQKLFVIAPGGEHPWTRRHGHDFPSETTITDQNGNITLQGWLAQWSMTTLLEPRTTLAYMAYLGYPSYGVSVNGPATPPANAGSGKSAGGIRSYFSSGSNSAGTGQGGSSSPSTPSGSGPAWSSSSGSGGGFWSSGSSSNAGSSASGSHSSRKNAKPRPLGPPTTTTALQVVKIPRKAERERFLRRGFGLSALPLSTSSASPNVKANKKKKGVPQRSVVLGYVFGAPGSGKTALLRAMVGREFDPLPSAGRHELSFSGGHSHLGGAHEKELDRSVLSTHSVVSAVEYGGAEKYLVLQEFEAAQEAEVLKSPKRLAAADVAVFVYDATNPESFAYLVNLRREHPQMGGLPTLFVATKSDLVYGIGTSASTPSGMMSPVPGMTRGRGMYGSPESLLSASPPREFHRLRGLTSTGGGGPGDRSPLEGSRVLNPNEEVPERGEDGRDEIKSGSEGEDGEDDDDDDIIDPRSYCSEELGLAIPALQHGAGPLEISVRLGQLADVYSVLCAIALDPTGAIPDAAAWDRELSRRRREGWSGWFGFGWLLGGGGGSGSNSGTSQGVGSAQKASTSASRSKKNKRTGGKAVSKSGASKGDEDGGAGKHVVVWGSGARARWVLLVVLAVGGAAASIRLLGVGRVGGGSGSAGEVGLGLWRTMLGIGVGDASAAAQDGSEGLSSWLRWVRSSVGGSR